MLDTTLSWCSSLPLSSPCPAPDYWVSERACPLQSFISANAGCLPRAKRHEPPQRAINRRCGGFLAMRPHLARLEALLSSSAAAPKLTPYEPYDAGKMVAKG